MPAEAKNPAQATADGPLTRFPPFPVAPEGVTVVSFKDFVEHGILISEGDDDEVERDGLGIPTIPLRTKHDTDVSKTNPNRKKKSAKEMAGSRPGFSKEWWADWAEGEDLRNHGPYDSNAARVDRFHQAASDFQKYRKFPPAGTNVQYLWDQFRIYAGLLGTTPVWQKASDKAADDDDIDDDDFDEVDDSKAKSGGQDPSGEKRFPPRPRPRAPYELYGKEPAIVEDDEQIRDLIAASRAKKEDKVSEFLDDPARAIQVFLSSYMRSEGMYWADRNLVNAPHVLRFFVNYLLRNHVLPDRTSERHLRSALQTIDAAAKELPLTSKISKILPDDFSRVCQVIWGRMDDNELDIGTDESVDSVKGEPEAKRVKPNPDAEAAFESVLKEENVEVIKTEDVLPAAVDPAAAPALPIQGEVGSDSAAWADSPAYDPSSFTPPDESWDGVGTPPETDWAPPPTPSVLPFLGPTALPLTHAPGIVEWSVRRIRAILAPPIEPVKCEKSDGPNAESVERALEGAMHRVVMAPWRDWDGPAGDPVLSVPRILSRSTGPLATPAAAPVPSAQDAGPSSSSTTDTPPPPPAPPGAPKPHDMLADDITLLVTREVAQHLRVGMGLGGTWVQLARLQDREPTVTEPAPAPAPVATPIASTASEGAAAAAPQSQKKKKSALSKAQKERRGLRYWYLDELMMTLPSYWLV
ncbi:hypothetical protein B0H11DRAFT_1963960 [Mycena galericulata]|nr:hypothetical protein B0H11DRAFT_1963960 [Mycena galericulata]